MQKGGSMKIGSYKDLNIWKKGMMLVKEIYKITENFPPKENFGLTSQMRRSAVSIPSNIAEGFQRRYHNEYKQFLYIALGSSAELETQTIISKELGYIPDKEEFNFCEESKYLSKMIFSLIKKL